MLPPWLPCLPTVLHGAAVAGSISRGLPWGPGYATAPVHRRTSRGGTWQADPHTCPLLSTSSIRNRSSCTSWAPRASMGSLTVCPHQEVGAYPMVETGAGLLAVYQTPSRPPDMVLAARECQSNKAAGLPGAFQEVHHGRSLVVYLRQCLLVYHRQWGVVHHRQWLVVHRRHSRRGRRQSPGGTPGNVRVHRGVGGRGMPAQHQQGFKHRRRPR